MAEPTAAQVRAWAARKLEEVAAEAERVAGERWPEAEPVATLAGPAGSEREDGFTAVRAHVDRFIATNISAAGFQHVIADDLAGLRVEVAADEHRVRYAFAMASGPVLTLVVPSFAAHVAEDLRRWAEEHPTG